MVSPSYCRLDNNAELPVAFQDLARRREENEITDVSHLCDRVHPAQLCKTR